MKESLKERFLVIPRKFAQPKILEVIILFQTLIIIALAFNTLSMQTRVKVDVLGQAQEIINQDVLVCNRLKPQERPACAERVGVKIATLFPSAEDRIRECMKFRPLFVRFCQRGLLSPSPGL